MLVFETQKIVYFAVPKNGSTAIEMGFGRYADHRINSGQGPKHMLPKQFYRGRHELTLRHPERSYRAVLSIRNPRDWLASYYRYRGRPAAEGAEVSTFGQSFEDFVLDYLSDPQPLHAKIGRQVAYFEFLLSRNIPYRIYPYDRLGEMLVYLNEQLGTTVVPPVANVWQRRPLELSGKVDQRLRSHLQPAQDIYDRVLGAGVLCNP